MVVTGPLPKVNAMKGTPRLVGYLLVLPFLFLSGCVATQNIPVEIDEDGVLFGNLSLLVPLWNEEALLALREGRIDMAHGKTLSLEFEGAFFSDDAAQTVNLGKTLRIDSRDFNGPGVVEYAYDVTSVTASGRFGTIIDGGLVFDALLGLSYHKVDLDGDFMGFVDGKSIDSPGILLGGQLSYYTPARIELSGKAWRSYGLDDSEVTNIELGLAYHFHPRASIELGYRWWDYTANGGDSLNSDVEIKLAGPQASLTFIW